MGRNPARPVPFRGGWPRPGRAHHGFSDRPSPALFGPARIATHVKPCVFHTLEAGIYPGITYTRNSCGLCVAYLRHTLNRHTFCAVLVPVPKLL